MFLGLTVVNFAKATGDLQTLSDVDFKLIALTYTLEAQIHGTQHLRDSPPPIQAVNVKRLPEKDLPGWGCNVPNIEEWEALEHAIDSGSNHDSRILPLKDLRINMDSADQSFTEDTSSQAGSESHTGNQEDGDGGFKKPMKYFPKKTEVKIDGKKMVADGIDASQGQVDDNGDDWRPAVSRSTHRRFLRRKARREMSDELSDVTNQQDASSNVENENLDDIPELAADESHEGRINATSKDGKISNEMNGGGDISANFVNMKLDEESILSSQSGHSANIPCEEIKPGGVERTDSACDASQEDYIEITDEELGKLESSSQTMHMDDISSEQSWTLRSLSESSVACITSDFAMQNVLLQIGLRLLAPGGMQIRELHRYT